jgi:hypothetical protein
MSARSVAFLGLLAVAFLACQARESESTKDAVSAAGAPEALFEDRSGTYLVRGVTVQAANGRLREISGSVVLSVEGDRYDANFELITSDPERGEAVPAEVRGKGKGYLVGNTLTGVTWQEFDVSGGAATLRVVSVSVGRFEEDGRLHVELQNYPAPDQDYSPTVTVLEGTLVGWGPRG